MRDEYGDIPGQGGNRWATMDTVLPDKVVHVQGTSHGPGGSVTFWMFNPQRKRCRIRCGICRRGMDGYRHCPYCYPRRSV